MTQSISALHVACDTANEILRRQSTASSFLELERAMSASKAASSQTRNSGADSILSGDEMVTQLAGCHE